MTRFTLGLLAAAFSLTASCQAFAGAVNGWLADCTATTSTSCTEITTTGYARQPVSFNYYSNGVVSLGNPYFFPVAGTAGATIAGRGIYDAPSGGNLQLVIPLAASITAPSYGDRGDVGSLKFTITATTNSQNLDGFVGNYAAGSTIGTTPDASSVTAGVQLQAQYGRLYTYPGDWDPLYSVANSQVTGFSVTIPNGTSTYGITGAGTLATGTIALQAAPSEGEFQRIFCDVTVTALTITVPSGYTAIGTLPTTCGANAAHTLEYFVAAKKVRVLF